MKPMRISNWAVVSRSLAILAGLLLGAVPLLAQGTRRPTRNPRAEAQAVPSVSAEAMAPEVDPKHPLVPAIALGRDALEALEEVKDYTCLFTKREAINQSTSVQKMQMKFRATPFSVYMRFVGGPSDGREVLFVDGQYQNNLLVHEVNGPASLIGTIPLAINSPQVAAENRHKITELGVANLARQLVKQWQAEAQFGESDVEEFNEAKVEGIACQAVRVTHPQPRKQFRFYQQVFYVNKETRIPVRVENYGWPRQAGAKAPLIEEYTYLQFKPNAGLTNADFDRRNRQYKFN